MLLKVDVRFPSWQLKADEKDRIGCGPEGFIAVQRDPWFADLDWVALLRKRIEPPWLPPPTDDGAAPCDAEFVPEVSRSQHCQFALASNPLARVFGSRSGTAPPWLLPSLAPRPLPPLSHPPSLLAS